MSFKINNIKPNFKKLGFFRFKKINQDYLLTNDIGLYVFLDSLQFRNFLEGRLKKESEVYKELEQKGFIKNSSRSQKARLINTFRSRSSHLFQPGPSLHIIVPTLRCNLKCIYCQAASRPLDAREYDMDLNIAKQTVDFIFRTPSPYLTIEFQGGEPLVNWPVVKFIVEYARRKNNIERKHLRISLVSNLILMDKERLSFFVKNRVNICTSLDGPEELHNRNRPLTKGNSYRATTHWLRKIQKIFSKRKTPYLPHFSALPTISRYSLEYPKEIVNEYLKWGVRGIHLRFLTYLGLAKNSKKKIGYSAEEFINFWEKSMDYIISVNKRGKIFPERESVIMLQKILTDRDPGYTDLRSPCGATLGQMLYNYDGNIYTCDEGRMLKNDTFLIGNIGNNDYQEVVSNNKVKTMITASCLENLVCEYCVYKPYCGVCPVRNFAYYSNLFPQIKNTDWCKIKNAQFDYIFSKMLNREVREIFKKWSKRS